jgi:hypothetical protein
MHILRHPDEVLAFVQNYSDPHVIDLIQLRMTELIDDDTNMEELVVFVILEPGDGIEQLQSQMDLQVMTDLGVPLWEVIEEHATCYELVFVLSSSGYGALVFAPMKGCVPDLFALCHEHAHRSPTDPPPDAIDAPVATETATDTSTHTAHRGGFFLPVQPKESHETH